LEIWDDSSTVGFPGIWWGHYKDEVPKGRCNVIAELDYNNYKKRPEVRLVAVQPNIDASSFNNPIQVDWILDLRGTQDTTSLEEISASPHLGISPSSSALSLRECPSSWDELQVWFRRAIQADRKLAIAYPPPSQLPPHEIWQQLVGIAKFLSRTGHSATLAQLQEKLDLSDRTIHLGLHALSKIGFQVIHLDWSIQINWHSPPTSLEATEPIAREIIIFLTAIEEEQFLRQYFYQVPLSTIQTMASQTVFKNNY
jgi:single-stranded-DNA-specific exonuclease